MREHEIDAPIDSAPSPSDPPAAPASQAPAGRRLLWLGLGAVGIVGLALVSASSTGLIRASIGEKPAAEPGVAAPPAGVLSVNSVTPRIKTLYQTFEQPASIRAWAKVELHAKVSGVVKRISREAADAAPGTPPPLKDIGSTVKAGEVLLEIDAPELHQDVVHKESLWKQAQAELERARADLAMYEAGVELETRKFARIQDLVKSRTVTEELLDEKKAELAVASAKLAACRADIQVKEARVSVARDELERARILADYTRIRAPFDGVITFREVDEGDFVQNASTGQPRPLMTLAAIDQVRLVLHVPEREAIWAEVGAAAGVEVDARVGWRGQGQVSRVSPALDAQTRTRQVEIDLDNQDHKLIPGMYGQVTLALRRIDQAVAIPATAVYSRRGENYIMQIVDGAVQRQRVRIRFDDGKELVVVKLIDGKEVPLDGTEELVVSNKGEIAEGQAVRATRLHGDDPQVAHANP